MNDMDDYLLGPYFQRDGRAVMSVGYFDSADMLEGLGQPSQANAERIITGMSYAAVVALIGEPSSIPKRNDGTMKSTVHWLTEILWG